MTTTTCNGSTQNARTAHRDYEAVHNSVDKFVQSEGGRSTPNRTTVASCSAARRTVTELLLFQIA